MKILQVNCVYKRGSTGKIVCDIHSELQKRGIESVVCYGRGRKIHDAYIFKTCSETIAKINSLWARISGVMYGSLINPNKKLKLIIEKEKPDIVHLHCINGFSFNVYELISYLKQYKINTVLTLHAEFMYTANCAYAFDCEKWKIGCGKCPSLKQSVNTWFIDNTALSWKKMQQAFQCFDEHLIVSSVSPWLMNRAMSSPILSGKQHICILNGLNTNIFSYKENNDIYMRMGLPIDKKIVFHVTPYFSDDINNIKGGYYVLKLAELMPEIIFVVAGPVIGKFNCPSNLITLGQIGEQERLARLYSAADITILTSRKETFSMVVAESLCCGTPVVGFKAGAPEDICIQDFSMFVEYGNVELLSKAVNEALLMRFDKQKISFDGIKKYSKSVMVDNYILIYKKLFEQNS